MYKLKQLKTDVVLAYSSSPPRSLRDIFILDGAHLDNTASTRELELEHGLHGLCTEPLTTIYGEI
jgi:hypothetical protein